MERRDHKVMPNQIYVKEQLRPKMAQVAKLLKPLQTDLAACKQTGPHSDPTMLPHFLYKQGEMRMKEKKQVDMHAWRL